MDGVMAILDALDRSRERALAAIESLPDEALLEPGVMGDFSTADLLALQAAWEAELVTGLMRLDQGVEPEKLLAALAQPDAYEARRIEEYRGRDLDRIFDDWQQVRMQLEGWLETFSERDLTSRGRFKQLRGKSLQQVIAAVSYEREAGYLADLEAFAMNKMMHSQIDPVVVAAARQTAVLVDRSDLGMLKINGQTRLDLIHRMSTQAVNGLQNGEGAATILTTDIGRIIDRLILYASRDTVYVLTGENNGDNIARYLMRFVFFNDDFQLQDVSAETAIFAIYGPRAKEKLAAAGLPEGDLPLHHWRQAEVAGVAAYLHRADPIAGDGYFIMCREADRDALWSRLLQTGLAVADEAAFDFLRIADGHPRFGYELTGDYIPLEAGLWDDVSFNKGCYTGQEIIARMESRGQLAKKLVKLQFAAPVSVGTAITAVGKNAGSVTSAAVGPDGVIGLGYVKTAVLDAGAQLMAGETAVTIQA